MSWRKWIVRGVVYGIIALCALAALTYQRWTNPAAVREQVIAKLHEMFPGAHVSIDSARLRILGGIQLTGLRLYRRDDPDRREFLYVPAAVIYHDKEKVLDGQLALRKVEFEKPRLRIRRNRDGTLNLSGLTGVVDPSKLLPTLVMRQGTVVFEDRMIDVDAPPVEVGDVDVTLINDPLPTITLRGAASSKILGKLQVRGTIGRAPFEIALHVDAQNVPVTTALVRRLAGNAHAALLDGLAVDALADVQGEVAYRAGQPLVYDVHGTFRNGKLRHPRLPLPLDELSATLHCAGNRLRLEALHARSGALEVSADGAGTLPALDQDFECRLAVKHLELCKELCDRLPEKLHKVYELFQPRGPATVQVACARRAGAWGALADGTPARVSIRPENAAGVFAKFPYPVDHLTGLVDYTLVDRHVTVDLAGRAGLRPVFIKGTWQGAGTQVEARFDIQASDVPIDETLLGALDETAQKLARSFRAAGKADIKAFVRHDPGAKEFRNQYHVLIHDAVLRWDAFPYPLEQVYGILDIYPRNRWEFRGFRAAHNGGHIEAHGHSVQGHAADGVATKGLTLEITGHHVRLDDELRQALTPRPGLLKAWDHFRPQGRLNFVATINHPTGASYDLDVRVDTQGGAVEPTFFPYLLHDIGGQFHYHQHRLDLAEVKAWHGGALLTLPRGSVDLHPTGGYYADFAGLEARDLRTDEELLAALPGKLREAARYLKLHDQCNLKTRLVVAQSPEPGSLPDVFWEDCQVGFRNATLNAGLPLTGVSGTLGCVGRHDGRQLLGLNGNILLEQATALNQPFHDVQLGFQIHAKAPDVLLVGLRAPLFGGDVAGQARVDFNSTLRYELNLTASQIDLKQFGRKNLGPKSEIEGLAVGRIHLSGQGSGIATLDGHGSIDVPNGKLLNLPLLFDLLKFLGLHWPDRTAFEELHALFGIHGTRVQLQKLDLLGNAISLAGKGEFEIDGSDLQVDFYPTWRVEQFLPTALRPLQSSISKNILTVEMRGKVSNDPGKDVKLTKRWVPALLDPFLELQQRFNTAARLEKKD